MMMQPLVFTTGTAVCSWQLAVYMMPGILTKPEYGENQNS